jgi:hypothetical protein
MRTEYYPYDLWRLSEVDAISPSLPRLTPIVSWSEESFYGHLLSLTECDGRSAVIIDDNESTSDEQRTAGYLTWVPAYLRASKMLLLPGDGHSDWMRVLFLRNDAAPEMKIVNIRGATLLHLMDSLKDRFFADKERRVVKVADPDSSCNVPAAARRTRTLRILVSGTIGREPHTRPRDSSSPTSQSNT